MREYAADAPFVFIPVGIYTNPTKFPGFAQKLWGQGFHCAVDTRSVTCELLGGSEMPSLLILGTDGKRLYKGGSPLKGSYYVKGQGNPPWHLVLLKDNVKKHLKKGLLSGLKVPAGGKPVARALRLGQLAAAQEQLARLSDDGEDGEFKKELGKRLEDLRASKLTLLDALVAANEKWAAHKVASSYLRCFPKAGNAKDIEKRVDELAKDEAVKKNLEAKALFDKWLPQIWGPRRNPQYIRHSQAIFKQIVDKYPETECGKLAAIIAKINPTAKTR